MFLERKYELREVCYEGDCGYGEAHVFNMFTHTEINEEKTKK